MKLKNKVALITGASRGIGRSIALEFANEDAIVIVNYNKSEKEAEELISIINKNGKKASVIKADISIISDITRMKEEIIKKYGKIDILVNNAGIYQKNNFFDSTEHSWDLTMNINLKGPYFCSQIIGKEMLSQKSGCIINISSNSGIMPRKNKGIEYGVSKAGLIYLTQSLALTLAPDVRVNCIAPGYTETEMSSLYKNSKLRAEIEKNIPLNRINMPEDVAKAALFLASEDSRNITGQIIIIDGGYNLR